MIALNEENFIARSLTNASKFVDEIIVVDGGSLDKTAGIALKYADHVFYNPWKENYADQRNYLLKRAKLGWVLFMDADEIFDNKLLKSLRKFVNNKFGIDAVSFPRKNYIDGKQTDAYPDRQIRLFKNNGQIKYKGRIHEKPEGWKLLATPADMHIIHKKSSGRQKRQTDYYNHLAKKYDLKQQQAFYKKQIKPGHAKTK